MTIIIGYQGKDHAVIGSDLLGRYDKINSNFNLECLEEKIKKSEKGDHYIAIGGKRILSTEKKIYMAPIESLLKSFRKPSSDFITDIYYFVIDVKNNQLYAFDGNSVNKLKNNTVILGEIDFVEKHIVGLIERKFSKLRSIYEKAELIKEAVTHACTQDPNRFQGVSVYHIQNSQINPYYNSHKTKEK